MVEQTAADYARILQASNLESEINPLCNNIEDMLARLDEFETLLSNVRAETDSIMGHQVCGIINFSDEFAQLRARIDNLEQFIGVINENLQQVEKSVDIAEQELNVSDYSFKSLVLKPLRAKLSATNASNANSTTTRVAAPTNLQENGEFKAVPIFKVSNYFVTRDS